jgi:uncharacterized protein YhfF
MDWRNFETFTFGDGPELADELLDLVLQGKKRATCWAESQGLLSAEVGKLMVVLDSKGMPKAVLTQNSRIDKATLRRSRRGVCL